MVILTIAIFANKYYIIFNILQILYIHHYLLSLICTMHFFNLFFHYTCIEFLNRYNGQLTELLSIMNLYKYRRSKYLCPFFKFIFIH